MFASHYFAPHYFGGRYFGHAGSDPSPAVGAGIFPRRYFAARYFAGNYFPGTGNLFTPLTLYAAMSYEATLLNFVTPLPVRVVVSGGGRGENTSGGGRAVGVAGGGRGTRVTGGGR